MRRATSTLVALAAFSTLATLGLARAEEKGVEKKPLVASPVVVPGLAPAGQKAFVDVALVLQSPRCMNCHPVGDAPLQTDESRPHKMNVSRTSAESGLACATCHQEENSEALGIPGGPPGAPNWHLPPRETPMIFEGRTVGDLCRQLRDPAHNGNKTLAELLEHVRADPLVLWGWNPGGDRTKPPLDHATFVRRFEVWTRSGGACPD